MHYPLVETTLLILSAVLTVNIIFRLFQLPVILGYLVVGVTIGPHVLNWVADTEEIKNLAELGVVFLMFTIGLEFSLSRLISLRYSVFVLGGLQVLSSVSVTTFIGLFLGMTVNESVIMGCVVAMSSTALVIKQLSEQFEIQSTYGLNTVGILLFQDLAVIPILVIIANLSTTGTKTLYLSLLLALLKGLIALVVIIAIGRWLLKPLFRIIASTRIIELFTLSVLFVAMGAAWITASLGLTLALGAFLSGIMLGETEFRHQINSEIRPFRDVLLGLFFVSIGMLANISSWIDTWFWILLLLIAIMVGKSILIMILCKLSKYDTETAMRTGLVLGQGGEFGFAILALALSTNLLPVDYSQVVLAALLISYALTPFIIRYNKKIAAFFLPKFSRENQVELDSQFKKIPHQLTRHVIICGFGRVGQTLSQFLSKIHTPYVGFDLDPEIIRNAQLGGEQVFYGNVTHIDILKAANIKEAAVIVISFADIAVTIRTLELLKRLNPKIPTLIRCKDQIEFKLLKNQGATHIVAEVFEGSLTLVDYLFQILKVPSRKTHTMLQAARKNNYVMLSQVFSGSFFETEEELVPHEHLRAIPLSDHVYAVRKTINNLQLHEVNIVSIRRGNKHLKPEQGLMLCVNDILILYGLPEHLDTAERVLLSGSN